MGPFQVELGFTCSNREIYLSVKRAVFEWTLFKDLEHTESTGHVVLVYMHGLQCGEDNAHQYKYK